VAKRSKRYQEAADRIDVMELYNPETAIDLALQGASTKFDETVELHARLNVDPRHADQQVRGVATLPHGLGRDVRVLVFAEGEGASLSTGAGADHVGGEDLVKRIRDGWLDFDIVLATQEAMRFVAPLGRVLGPRGLMPNARTGTVVIDHNDLPAMIKESKQGRVEFRVDKSAIIHGPIGKASFDKQQLLENLSSLMDAITRARPDDLKGQYIATLSLSTTMGPGVKMDVNAATALTEIHAA